MIRFELMHLDGKSHGSKQPTFIYCTFHSASTKIEDLFYYTLHRLNAICSLFVNLFEFGLEHDSHNDLPLF